MHTTTRTTTRAAIAAAIALALAGCASLPPGLQSPGQYAPTTYAPGAMQQAQQVQTGTIISIVPVMVRASGTDTAAGTGLGAVVGGLLGHQVGGGNGKTLATVAGAVAGGIGGGMATQRIYSTPALQITVRLAGCQGGYDCTIAVTQAASAAQPLSIGERVQVVQGGWGSGAARVLPLR
jgi:outer membrane lipoprotein SlyB